MITMEILGRIRRMFLRDRLSYSEISRRTGIARNTVKRWLKGAVAPQALAVAECAVTAVTTNSADGLATALEQSIETKPIKGAQIAAPKYHRHAVPKKLARYVEELEQALVADALRIKRDRRTGKQLFERIKAVGYSGGYTQLSDFIRHWRARRGSIASGARQAFIPLVFALGEAFQFDWSEEGFVIGGIFYRMQVSHMKLCASRAFWLVAYPSQGHEMLFDAHTRSFAALGGIPRRGIYDNMKTAVDKVGRGKLRTVNARFAAMCAHYLFDPDFCNVASGWEKGVVEKNVQDARRRIWLDAKTQRFATFDALNAWLADRCRALWAEIRHPEHKSFTVAEMLEQEQAHLMPMPTAFDGYVETLCRVSSTCLVVVDGNRYSVPCEWVRQRVSARVYTGRIEIVGEIVGGADLACAGDTQTRRAIHVRLANRGRTAYDWQHYIPLVQRKPGALRNGAPFAELPSALKALSGQLLRRDGGDRIMAQVLSVVPVAGLEAVLVAVELMLEGTGSKSGAMVSAEHVVNVISRLSAVPPTPSLMQAGVPASMTLAEPPRADTARYDQLRAEVRAGADHA